MTVAATTRWRVDLSDALPPPSHDDAWRRLASRGDTDTVFQQLPWLRAWWSVHGRGELLVATVAAADGEVIAVAPMFVDGGMAFVVGSGAADSIDLVGDAAAPGVAEAIVGALLDARSDLLGLRLYLVPDASRTGVALRRAAGALGLDCHDEGDLVAPALALGGGAGIEAAGRRSLLRHERGCARLGRLTVEHLGRAADIAPRLDEFFDQHRRRWAATPHPSLFEDPRQRDFYRAVTAAADNAGWLRFTVVAIDNRPVACHFGYAHAGRWLWYKPSFEIELARHSPGEVLLRHLLLAAVGDGAQTFDFGIGDEAFKLRFADRLPRVRTWGLYPRRGKGGAR